jgi:uncharacterized protein YhaN
MSGETEERPSGWTVDTLKVHFDDLRRDDKEAVRAALASADKANDKYQRDAEAWRAQANEWRAAMNDRERDYPTRRELLAEIATVVASIDAQRAQIAAVERQVNAMVEQKKGFSSAGTTLTASVGFVLALLSIASTVIVIVSR